MKTYFTLLVVVLAILSLVRDSEEFSAAAGTTIGRRSLEKRLASCEVIENECQSLRQKIKENNRLRQRWSNTRFEENDAE